VPVLSYIVTALAAYLLGSIPTGFLVAKARGVDIRTVGSGNIGATNTFRVLGKPAGILVLLFDALKGYLACVLGAVICIYFFNSSHEIGLRSTSDTDSSTLPPLQLFAIIAGICAVLGHNYTCWLKFKGGKGIATTAGVYFALAPLPATTALATWIVFTLLTRYVSVGSITAAIALCVTVWATEKNLLLGIVTTALSTLAILKHKKNIQRLMAGTENRIGQKNPVTEDAK
jgi:glycerol-3-phosphate acyltransferase PlsY